MDKTTYVWIGKTEKSEEEFYKYFKIFDNAFEEENWEKPDSKFSEDVGIIFFDEDLYYAFFNKTSNDLKATIEEIKGFGGDIYHKIIDVCEEKKIHEANAVFIYSVFEKDKLPEISTDRKYNGMYYIGEF